MDLDKTNYATFYDYQKLKSSLDANHLGTKKPNKTQSCNLVI